MGPRIRHCLFFSIEGVISLAHDCAVSSVPSTLFYLRVTEFGMFLQDGQRRLSCGHCHPFPGWECPCSDDTGHKQDCASDGQDPGKLSMHSLMVISVPYSRRCLQHIAAARLLTMSWCVQSSLTIGYVQEVTPSVPVRLRSSAMPVVTYQSSQQRSGKQCMHLQNNGAQQTLHAGDHTRS